MASGGGRRNGLHALVQRLKFRLRRVWLHWDRYPKDGTRDHPFCGIIEIRGWALALDGVRSIDIYCDDTLLGTAAIGLRRRDVFENFPYIRASRRCGFQYVLDTTRIENGLHELTVVGKTTKGRVVRLTAPAFVRNLATRMDRYRRQTAASAASLAWMRRNQHHLPYRPRIALTIRAVASATMDDLAATISSLSAQVYDDWRLYISADPDLADKSRARLAQWSKTDCRIRLEGPSEDENWFALLDAGDVLTPDALFEMVYYQNRHPKCDLIYSAGWYALSLRRACPTPSRASKTQGVPCSERAALACASGWYEAEQTQLHRPGQTTYQTGYVPKTLCRRARSAPQPISRLLEQPVVLTHAPCPLLDLENVRSILLVKLDHLGDVLLTIPAMRRLRELCPEARITALVGSWAQPIVEAEPCIDEVLTYDFFAASSARNCRRLGEADYLQIAGLLEGRRFDLAIDLRRESDTREFLWHSGATITVGYANRGEHDWLTVAIPWDDVNAVQPPRRHVALDALRLVEMVALSARGNLVSDYRLIGTDASEANRLLDAHLPAEPGLLVGLHPGAGRAIKCWPPERFAQIADRFIDEFGATVVLFGTDADARQVQDFLCHVRRRERLVSLANQVTLPQFIALLKRFEFFIGNDSGPTHMAAASGIPTLGVYAATIDASQWGPLGPQAAVIQKKMHCSPCYLAKKPDCPYGIACLEEISVEEVWEAAVRVLLPKWGKIKSISNSAAVLGVAR